MNAHGGDLWVKSSGVHGEGCLFGMDLQVAYMDTLDDVMYLSNEMGHVEENRDTLQTIHDDSDSYYGMMHVLVVDDSPMNRKMLMLQLRGFGIEHITHACNGLEAVEVVEKRMTGESHDKLFDIIYMDSLMPVMGGNEATRRIRDMGYAGAIVSVTGNGLPEDVREIMSCGSNRILVKPVKAGALAESLRGE